MELFPLAGNRRVKELLSRAEEGRGLSHAYLISGPVGSGRHTLARLLAQAMVCEAPPSGRPCGRCAPCRKAAAGIHPDISAVAGAEGRPVTVDQVRALRTDAYVRPNEGRRKVYLVEGAHRMNAAAQNAMLKLLEEGPAYAAFLLLSENPDGVLETVRSRCEGLTLTPVTPREGLEYLSRRFPDRDRAQLERAALDCQGLLGRAVEALSGDGAQARAREELAQALCDALAAGDECALFEASMALEKAGKEELAPLLDELEVRLGRMAARAGDRRRLVRGAELVRTLRGAQRLNVGQGQLAGWLCAGMFRQD